MLVARRRIVIEEIGITGPGGVEPITTGAVLGRIVVGGLVPLLLVRKYDARARVARPNRVVAGERVRTGLRVAHLASTIVEPVNETHGIDGRDKIDRAFLVTFLDRVGVTAVFTFAGDFHPAIPERIGIRLGLGIEERGVFGVAHLVFPDLVNVIDRALSARAVREIDVRRVARITDGDEPILIGGGRPERFRAVRQDQISLARRGVPNPVHRERICLTRCLRTGGQPNRRAVDDRDFLNGQSTVQLVIR